MYDSVPDFVQDFVSIRRIVKLVDCNVGSQDLFNSFVQLLNILLVFLSECCSMLVYLAWMIFKVDTHLLYFYNSQ